MPLAQFSPSVHLSPSKFHELIGMNVQKQFVFLIKRKKEKEERKGQARSFERETETERGKETEMTGESRLLFRGRKCVSMKRKFFCFEIHLLKRHSSFKKTFLFSFL